MALKERKTGRDYSLDEMMYMINYNFITKTETEPILNYTIQATSWQDADERWLVCDSRDEEYVSDGRLEDYYGSTILEAVTLCFNDRQNHSIYNASAKF